VLSFELFVAVILGGARLALGPVVGLAVIAGFSNAAEEIGAARGLPPGRIEEMLTGYGMLLVLGLGGAGLLPFAGAWWRRIRPRRDGARAETPAAPGALDNPAPLAARRVSKRFGNLEALDRLELEVAPGTIHALIGPNGSGKTTALKVISGQIGADDGSIVLDGEDLAGLPQPDRAERGVVGTQQTTAVFPDLTVLENALVGAGLRRRSAGPFRTFFRTPIARADERRAEERALAALAFVGLDQGTGRQASELTAHEQRLLMIASALATEPRVLLLDEPAAGASAAELERLAGLLRSLRDRGLGLLVIEHNLRFVRRVADLVTVLEAGRRIASGTLAEVAADEAVRTAYLGRQSL
jgi:branched-chain amino acid transport system ATP-binding protein/branched-chain amino acid transport system permease protein